MNRTLEAQVVEALHRVFDPCSLAANAPLSLIDMGLIRDWRIDREGNLTVRACVTSACCTMAPHFVRAAEEQLAKIPGVTSVRVELDPAFFWTPEAMSPHGKAALEARRRRSIELTGLRPQQWRETRGTAGSASEGCDDQRVNQPEVPLSGRE
jgi:metal-sulfur cluster biosynthetic enzyme